MFVNQTKYTLTAEDRAVKLQVRYTGPVIKKQYVTFLMSHLSLN